MRHVFLDASVLLAFSRSTTGGSAFILECCEQRKIKGYISKKVVFESKKNVAEDMGEEAIKALAYVFSQGFLTVVPDCTKEELENAHKAFNNQKDAPIIAAAKHTPHITHIISLDNGFFKPEVIKYVKPKEIVKPGEFIQRFRKQLEK